MVVAATSYTQVTPLLMFPREHTWRRRSQQQQHNGHNNKSRVNCVCCMQMLHPPLLRVMQSNDDTQKMCKPRTDIDPTVRGQDPCKTMCNEARS